MRVALLTLCSLLVALVLVEGVLRIARISYPVLYRRDTALGVWHREGVSGWYNREGVAWVEINSAGMRDEEIPIEKPPDHFRIAVLGDSYTEAVQVPAESNFTSVIERELASCDALGGRTPQALNFGVSGFGTAQALLTLRNRAWAYSPDAVLLAFVSNDVRNNSRALERDPTRPYFVFRGEHLVLDDGFLGSRALRTRNDPIRLLRDRLSDHFRLVQLVTEARAALMRRHLGATGIADGERIYRESADPEWIEAWRVTEGILAKLASETAERGVPFLLMKTTDRFQVDPDREARQRRAQELGATDLQYVDRRLLALARREGFPALSLAPDFLAHAETNGACLHGFENAEPCGGHWNAEGHRLAGEYAARWICELAARGFRPRDAGTPSGIGAP